MGPLVFFSQHVSELSPSFDPELCTDSSIACLSLCVRNREIKSEPATSVRMLRIHPSLGHTLTRCVISRKALDHPGRQVQFLFPFCR